MKVAVVQIAPVFLDKTATWQKLKTYILDGVKQGVKIFTWGETLLPGYPQWLSETNGASFDDENQKLAYNKYWQESLTLDDPIVKEMQAICKEHEVMLIGGISERKSGSVYCSALKIDFDGTVLGTHKKIKPTYEERLIWADGDGKGLKVHPTPEGKIGVLNCWENWIPYPRAYLHSLEEFIHVSLWPGSLGLTEQISKFIAKEGRYYVIAASAILRGEDFAHLDTEEFPFKEQMMKKDVHKNGGSLIVSPKGEVIAGPLLNEEGLLTADINMDLVIQERQNFDYSGHYSRDDIFELVKN